MTDSTEQHRIPPSAQQPNRDKDPIVPNRKGNRLKKINKDPRTTFIINCVIVLTLVIGIPGAAVAVKALRGAAPDTGTPRLATQTPSVSHPSTHPESASPKPTASSAAVTCLNSTKVEVPCGDIHEFEIVPLHRMPNGACDDVAVLMYLGGVVGRDVTTVSVDFESGHDKCIVQAPEPQSESFEGVLGATAQAKWRACRNEEGEMDVPCDAEHTGEYVGWSSAGDSTSKDCAEAVEKYVGSPFTLIDDRVTWKRVVRSDDKPTAARCVIVARGRGLGIPIVLRNLNDLQFELVSLR